MYTIASEPLTILLRDPEQTNHTQNEQQGWKVELGLNLELFPAYIFLELDQLSIKKNTILNVSNEPYYVKASFILLVNCLLDSFDSRGRTAILLSTIFFFC